MKGIFGGRIEYETQTQLFDSASRRNFNGDCFLRCVGRFACDESGNIEFETTFAHRTFTPPADEL
jgi:hypothetical protein